MRVTAVMTVRHFNLVVPLAHEATDSRIRDTAGRDLANLPEADRRRIAAVMRDLRAQANAEAQTAWNRRKAPMAAYWRAVSTYARHLAHALEAKHG